MKRPLEYTSKEVKSIATIHDLIFSALSAVLLSLPIDRKIKIQRQIHQFRKACEMPSLLFMFGRIWASDVPHHNKRDIIAASGFPPIRIYYTSVVCRIQKG